MLSTAFSSPATVMAGIPRLMGMLASVAGGTDVQGFHANGLICSICSLDNLAELKQSVYEYEISCGEESTLEHYLAHVALFSNSDAQDSKGKVKLMTVHAAKGLEFPYVFLCAMNEGIFPSKKTSTIDGMEEERRLAFVAMTRAQKTTVSV